MNSTKSYNYVCLRCQNQAPSGDYEYTCPSCGSNLEIINSFSFQDEIVTQDEITTQKKITTEQIVNEHQIGFWRYEPLLPIGRHDKFPPLLIGNTPLIDTQNLADYFKLKKISIKDETRNPSLSFKDRASAMVLSHAMQLGEKTIVAASTGNAASSLACLSSGTGIQTIILIPQNTPSAKIAQLVMYGAKVVLVKGTYDDAFDLSVSCSKEFGWYNRNTGFNPFTREGKKTCSFEIAEQLEWSMPDYLIVPVGDGNIISGIWKGIKELNDLKIISNCPKLVAIQASGSDAIHSAFTSKKPIQAVKASSQADSINVSFPKDGDMALRAIEQSEGFTCSVTDEEIFEGVKLLASNTGVFAEPSAAATVAGLNKLCKESLIENDSHVLLLITGHGLKDYQHSLSNIKRLTVVSPEMSSFKKQLPAIFNQ